MAKNLDIKLCTKYIATHHHYTKKEIETWKINLIYIPFLEQVGNIFTKPLRHGLLEKFKLILNIISIR